MINRFRGGSGGGRGVDREEKVRLGVFSVEKKVT